MSEPITAEAFQMYVTLTNINDPRFFVADPAIVAGDFQVSIDGGALADLTNLPVTDPAGSKLVKLDLTAAEMTGTDISIVASDQDATEWEDLSIAIQPNASGNIDTVVDLLQGDISESSTSVTIKKRGSAEVLLQKDIAGSLLSPSITVTTSDP